MPPMPAATPVINVAKMRTLAGAAAAAATVPASARAGDVPAAAEGKEVDEEEDFSIGMITARVLEIRIVETAILARDCH
ncbi:hypothetical protein [Achromobacter sp. HZ28]|uniref:hypothetical protein n=1 Tax=Achromobacter sp. HZ28 TaxID=2015171 RepID=UPI001E4AE0A2|nr:hypothetical protein [Achromobacter sp. HZ28]